LSPDWLAVELQVLYVSQENTTFMNWKIPTFTAAFTLMAGLCLADLKTDFDHSTNFGRYHTYSWLKVSAGDSLWSDRIKSGIDSALQAKGWQMVPSGGDASVSAFGSTKEQPTLNTFYDGFGGGWGWRRFGGMGMGETTTTVENTPVGTLVVDIFDSQSKKLIWRGVDTKNLSENPEKNTGKLNKTIQDMFKKFPPPEKG
jgi:hypothetical protein